MLAQLIIMMASAAIVVPAAVAAAVFCLSELGVVSRKCVSLVVCTHIHR